MPRNGQYETLPRDVYCDHARVWHVTRYADLRDALKTPDLGANFRSMLARHPAFSYTTTSLLRGSPIFIDGPLRMHIRHMVVTYMRHTLTDALRASAQDMVTDLVNQIEPDVETDAVQTLAEQLPARVMRYLTGLPGEIGQIICQHAATLGEGSTEAFPSTKRAKEIENSAQELTNYLGPQLAQRLKNPGDDLLSYLVLRRDTELLDDEGLLALAVFLLIAAQVTTASFLSAIVQTLAGASQILPRLSVNPMLRRGFLNEVLRLETPLQIIVRRCLRDTSIGGVSVPADAGVMLHLGTGNRDPDEFEIPGLFLASRPNVLNHLAFGGGSRACPGARLALFEGEAMAEALGKRFRRISADRSCQWKKGQVLKSITELPVIFHA